MAILDLKEKIEPFRKNATGYVKQLLSADHVVMSDGTTLQTKMDSLNSALTCIDYKVTLQQNSYVAPYTHYLNWYVSMDDTTNYGIPIYMSVVGGSGIPMPCTIVYSDEVQKYRCTTVGNTNIVYVTIVYLSTFNLQTKSIKKY